MALSSSVSSSSAAAPAPSLDPGLVARFRRAAVPGIVAALVVLGVGSIVYPLAFPEKEGPDFERIIGETYTNVYLYFGAPQGENSDGRGGRVLHYDEFRVIDDHFEKREFRIFVNPQLRVYAFERD